ANAGEGGFGGAITAALFLETFVRDRLPWIHFGIGAIISPSPDDPLYGNPEYTTGIPAMTLIEYFRLMNHHRGRFENVSDNS
nr:hypothetical protein [bacterium]